jgi:uncharacterized protein
LKLENFTIFLTDRCNYTCTYCYQSREINKVDQATIERALHYFYPYFADECTVDFYGGEPLLAFEEITQSVAYLHKLNKKKKKKLIYSFTTNGSLINEEILSYLNTKKFKIMVSFDGLAQEISRPQGSFKKIVSILKKFQYYPSIGLSSNSVFTPQTIHYMTDSMKFLVNEFGLVDNNNQIDTAQYWTNAEISQLERELQRLRQYLVEFYEASGNIPVRNYRPVKAMDLFWCSACRNRMSISPDGKVWGCYLFHSYFKGKERTKDYEKFCLGDLSSLIDNFETIYQKKLPHYSKLRIDHFFTEKNFCMMCEDLEECRLCPVYAGFSGSVLGRIQSWQCEIEKLLRKERQLFLKEIDYFTSS